MNQNRPLVPIRDAWQLPVVTSFPRYDRSKLGCGIAHLSLGNFHRSHLALFMHEYLQTHPDEDWMIHAIGLRPADQELVGLLNKQGNLYTLLEQSGSHDTVKIIGSIKDVWDASDPQRVIDLLAADHIKIISLTVTEAGYYYDAHHNLVVDKDPIRAELDQGATPTTVFGYLYGAVEQRMQRGGSGFTVLCCDNLPENGDLVRRLLLDFADRKNPDVADWIRENVSFPNSMVDRITPAVSEEKIAWFRTTYGIDDQCPVMSEAYLEWVLQGEFKNGRPALETVKVAVQLESETTLVSVQFPPSVAPYETIKMRLLNGSHSALAYVAYLMGYRHVDTAMNDPEDPDDVVRTFVQRYMDEDVSPTLLDLPADRDLAAYKRLLLERFANPATADQVQRLAEKGSAKIRNFMVPALEYQLATNGSITWMAFVLAAWFRYLRGVDENNQPITIREDDSIKDVLTTQAKAEPLTLLRFEEIFGAEIAKNARLAAEVSRCLEAMNTMNMRDALSQWLKQ